jgi:hypothetical protein
MAYNVNFIIMKGQCTEFLSNTNLEEYYINCGLFSDFYHSKQFLTSHNVFPNCTCSFNS